MAGSGTLAMAAVAGSSMVMEEKRQQNIQKQNRQYYEQQLQAKDREREVDVQGQEDRLKRLTASHRARMAAAGIAPDEGSSGALLEGLEETTQKQIDERNASYRDAVSSLNNQSSSQSIAPTTESRTQANNDRLSGTNSILMALQGWD